MVGCILSKCVHASPPVAPVNMLMLGEKSNKCNQCDHALGMANGHAPLFPMRISASWRIYAIFAHICCWRIFPHWNIKPAMLGWVDYGDICSTVARVGQPQFPFSSLFIMIIVLIFVVLVIITIAAVIIMIILMIVKHTWWHLDLDAKRWLGVILQSSRPSHKALHSLRSWSLWLSWWWRVNDPD